MDGEIDSAIDFGLPLTDVEMDHEVGIPDEGNITINGLTLTINGGSDVYVEGLD